jgi:hypothetical protein
MSILILGYYFENRGHSLSIDEVNLSIGELYSVVTNKEAKGKKVTIMAIATGTKAETVINHLHRIALIKETKLLKSL